MPVNANVDNVLPEDKTTPAGFKDSGRFSIHAVDTQIYFKGKGSKPYNVLSNSFKREVLSIDLEEGMSIKAVTYENRNKMVENIEK